MNSIERPDQETNNFKGPSTVSALEKEAKRRAAKLAERRQHRDLYDYKVSILFAVVAAAHASAILYGGHAALVNTGVSARSMKQDGLGNYAFAYDIKDGKGATNSRSEVGNGHAVKGAYTLADIDGRARKVEYVADGHGFRAVVKTNEPGTAASAPAAALIASPYGTASDAGIKHIAAVGVAPVAVAGHGLGLGLGVAGLGLGNGLGLGHGAGLGVGGLGLGLGGLGHGAGLGVAGLGYGYGAGVGKGMLL